MTIFVLINNINNNSFSMDQNKTKEFCVLELDESFHSLLYNNLEFCLTQECINDFYIYKAIAAKNTVICNNLSSEEYKDVCYAIILEDNRKCPKESDICMATTLNNVNLCNDDECKNEFLSFKSILENNKTICNEISDEELMDFCIQFLDKDIAFIENKYTVCN